MVEAVMAENAGAYREVSAAESVEDSTEVAERVEERWVEEMEECKVADMRGDASEEEKGAVAAVVLSEAQEVAACTMPSHQQREGCDPSGWKGCSSPRRWHQCNRPQDGRRSALPGWPPHYSM